MNYFPNGWPEPTFMFIDDDGTIQFEWNFGSGRNCWGVSFTHFADENALALVTDFDGQWEEQDPTKVANFLARALDCAKGPP